MNLDEWTFFVAVLSEQNGGCGRGWFMVVTVDSNYDKSPLKSSANDINPGRPQLSVSVREDFYIQPPRSATGSKRPETLKTNSDNQFILSRLFSQTCVWVCVWLYLFQVQSDSHIVILHPILDRRTLPPLVCPVYSIFYGMSFCETNTKRDTSYSVEIYLAPQPCRFPKEKNVPLCFFFV